MTIDHDIQKAVGVLKKGGVILYPTDTIWGIGCDATNMKAAERIYRIKERMGETSMIILVSDLEMLKQYVSEVPEIARELISSMKEPLTVIYPGARNLPKNVLAKDNSIAIRIPRHDFCQAMIRSLNKPITSTSANLSGAPNPFTFSGIAEAIKESVDYIVPVRYQFISRLKPSTIVRIDPDGEMHIVRN